MQEAIVIERYILRRAGGLYYAVVAAEISLILVFDILFNITKLTSDYGLIVPLAFNTSVSILGAAAAVWVFKKAYNALLVRREIVDSVWTKLFRPSGVAALWLTYYLPILLTIIFLRPIAGAVLLGTSSHNGAFLF